MEWSLLPPATEEMAAQVATVKGRFMGDPSHEYEQTEFQKMSSEGEKPFEEDVVVREEGEEEEDDRRRRKWTWASWDGGSGGAGTQRCLA